MAGRIWHLATLLLVHELNSAPVVLTDQEETLSGGNSARLFSGLFQSAQSQSWLEDWLWHLQVEIPTISDKKGGFNLTVSNGLCTHFKIAKIDTVKNPSNLQITASGLEIFCRLRWDAKSRLLPDLGGEVVAQVSNAELGGPISIVSDGLQPPLPKAINAHGCSGTIKAEFTFTGSGVSTVLEFLKPLIQSIINDRLAELICSNLDQVLEDQGSEALLNASGEVRKILRESPTPPPTPVIEDPKKELIDFGENSGMELIHSIVTKVLGNQRSPNSANALLERYLGSEGNFSLDSLVTLPYNKVVEVEKLGRFNITLESCSFSHLNTVSAMDFYSPQPQELEILLQLAHLAMDARLTLGVKPQGSISGDELKESFTTSLKLSQFSMGGTGFLALNRSVLSPLGADQLGEVGCVAPGVDAAALLHTDLGAEKISSALTPQEKGEDLEHDVDHMLNAVASYLLSSYQEALHEAGQALILARGMELVNSKVKDTLQNAGACPPPFEDYSNETLSIIAYCLSWAFFFASFCMCLVRRRGKADGRSRQVCQANSVISTTSGTGSSNTNPTSLMVETGLPDSPLEHTSLAFHPRISPAFRWGLPLFMLSTMCLFLSSNSGIGAVVRLVVTANGQSVATIPPVFGFSLISSIKDMFDGKVYALGLLIICFSGLWPYIKPMLMMMCWFTPPSRLSVAKRQGLLNFLDAFGKWSLVDTFVMILFMVAFKFDLSAPDGPGILQDIFRESGDSATFGVQVDAMFGFYTFLIATFMSLVCGHVTTACHRYAHKLGEFAVEDDVLEKTRLCYKLEHNNLADVHGPTVAISVSLLLVLCGTFLQSFNFNFLGLAGYALGPEQHRPFSVFSLGMKIPEASGDPDGFWILMLQGVFFLFAIIVVVVYHIILIVLWTAPMSTRMQKQFFLTAQVLNAWSGLDVFCVTILAGVLEIRQFADFIVGNKCDSLDQMLAKSPLADEMPGGVMTCFDVDSTLRAGFIVLAVAVVISTITGQIMLAKCSDRLCDARRADGAGAEAA